MSGMTELTGLATIRDVPQWIFHGDADNDTNVETGYGGAMVGSRAVVRALHEIGGKPRYTEYPNEQHVIWHRAYGETALLRGCSISECVGARAISPNLHADP